LVTRKAVKQKVIQELSVSDKAKLERFELSVEELKGVRTEPKRINLQEVERLNPKSATELDKIIVENRGNLVVGGSVAQRAQILGKSRLPVDVDIFTSRNIRGFANEIGRRLTDSGVERVSVVRGKLITIAGKKAIEVKDIKLLRDNVKKVQLPFETFSSALETTPRGIRVLGLGAQAKRKVIGGFGLERERIREKDITDLPAILSSLRRIRESRRGSVFIPTPRGPPRAVPISISLLREEPSSFVGRRGEPARPGGISFLRFREPSAPSFLAPTRFDVSSVLGPVRRELPSVITSIPSEPSVLFPTPPQPLSVLTPDIPSVLGPRRDQPSVLGPTKDVPSILEPTPERPTPTRRFLPSFDRERTLLVFLFVI